jgi:cephalosporin hydroxylase
MEFILQQASVLSATLIGSWIKFSRRALLRKRSEGARFVPIGQRCWSSDLPLSKQLFLAIQHAKYDGRGVEQPPIKWRGALNMKDPFSLATYPLLISELRPATVIEIGAYAGGSACWMADMLTALGIDGRVYSFDINVKRIEVQHPGVEFKWADANDLTSFDAAWLAQLPHPWLVIEDAHQNVSSVLRFFDQMMQPGDYFIVEDTLDYGKYRQMKGFLDGQPENYSIDTLYTDLFGYNVTWHPNSYLKKT